MDLQAQNVVVKRKATMERHGHVNTYVYLLKSADEQVTLTISSSDDAMPIGQEYEVILKPVEQS